MIRAFLTAFVFMFAAVGPAYAQSAVIRGLDKITGQARDYAIPIGRSARIGSLEVIARSCDKSAPEEPPEVRIYVEVYDTPAAREGEEAVRSEIWHGWLFASSPGLSGLDHPAYDIWAVDCR